MQDSLNVRRVLSDGKLLYQFHPILLTCDPYISSYLKVLTYCPRLDALSAVESLCNEKLFVKSLSTKQRK